MNIGILLLRLIVELILTSRGIQKLLGWFGGPGLRHAPMETWRRPGRSPSGARVACADEW
jgi:uncharacterized membrane protein YphA (DoxX/SURF4 family)